VTFLGDNKIFLKELIRGDMRNKKMDWDWPLAVKSSVDWTWFRDDLWLR